VDNQVCVDWLKWGLVPPHEPEPKVEYNTFNARAENLTKSQAYRHAWGERHRCLVPVEAFFEWKGAKSPKQKYRISVRGQSQFCLAGLWEKWQRDDEILETFTIITTVANELVAEIHDKKRMPVIIKPEDYDRWLRATYDVTDLLKPFTSELMEAIPIGKRVTPRDDGPSLFTSNDE
jgi:putative SOS response-associated peptidase YedK